MIHIVIGTRAQLLKMAPVMRELAARGLRWRWIYTAQHRETIDEIRQVFELPEPDMTVFQWRSEAKTMGKLWYWLLRMLVALGRGRRLLDGHTGSGNVVVTHGDTLTTLWAATLGRIYRCRVLHVEAGLRSRNLFRPFPEEIVRLLTSRLAHIYACPGSWACNNLRRHRGLVVDIQANTQLDTLRFGLTRCDDSDFEVPTERYVVASVHRAETIFRPRRLERVVELLEQIATEFTTIFILHPATEGQLRKTALLGRLESSEHINTTPRLDYLSFIKAIKHSSFVVTDGGGNQEELSYLGKPTLILRSESERAEGIRSTAVLSNFNPNIVEDFMRDHKRYDRGPSMDKATPSVAVVDALEAVAGPTIPKGSRGHDEIGGQ